MPQPAINATLSPSEWHLIEAIRALPESTLRNRTHEVLGQLLFFVQNPRCQGMGAEGFPCGAPLSACDECQLIWDLLDGISRRLNNSEVGI
jgi:hypothetical protein